MSIRRKIILGIVFIELSLLSLLVIGTLSTLSQSNEEDLMRRVFLSEKLLVASVKDALITHDFAALNSIAVEMLKTEQFAYLHFLDETGFTRVELNQEKKRKRLFVEDKRLDTVDDGVFDKRVLINVAGIHYGEIQFGISIKPRSVLLTQTWQWMIAVSLLNILLVSLFSWLLGGYFVRQLMSLRDANRRFAAGDLSCRLKIKGKDELAETALTFNNMAEQLMQTNKTLSTEILTHKETAMRLRKANTTLANFTHIAAHHLQESPRRLISFVQHLKSQLSPELLTEDAKISLKFIEESAIRQRALVQALQRFIDAEKPQVITETLEFQPFLDKVQQHHAQMIKELNATITVHDLPPVVIDKVRLYDICHILLDNALHYHHPDRRLKIEVKSESRHKKNYYYFSDNGLGIPKQYHERVFQIFEYIPVAKDEKTPTGVGLAIVKRIIESCDGHIFLQENTQGGVTVVLEFPQIIKARLSNEK